MTGRTSPRWHANLFFCPVHVGWFRHQRHQVGKKKKGKETNSNKSNGWFFWGGRRPGISLWKAGHYTINTNTCFSSLGKSLRHVSNICIVWSLYGKSNSVNLKKIAEKRQFTHVEPSLASDLFFSSPAWAGFESGMDGQCFCWHKQIIQQYNLNRSQFVIQKHMGVSKNRGGPPKWMVKIMETPIKMGWFGGPTPIFGNIHILQNVINFFFNCQVRLLSLPCRPLFRSFLCPWNDLSTDLCRHPSILSTNEKPRFWMVLFVGLFLLKDL